MVELEQHQVRIIKIILEYYKKTLHEVNKKYTCLNSRKGRRIIMEKNTFGKGIGIGGAVAVIIGIICQLTHNGVP